MKWLRQSTATTRKMGPFVDNLDGYTPETGLTISQADVRISKNGGAYAQKSEATSATHDENGWYGVPFGASDTDTLGCLRVAIYESGALPVWEDFMVVPAQVYDALVLGTDNLDINLLQVLGTTLTETGAGYLAAALKKWLDVATPTGTVNSLPDAVPGAAGGLPTTNGTNLNQPPADMALNSTVAKEATLGTPVGASMSADVAAVQAVVDGLQAAPRGVALVPFVFVMRDSNFLPRTGLTVTGTVSKDGGAFAALTNPITEVGNGSYKIALGISATEMTAAFVDLYFTAPGAIPTKILIKTQE